MEACVTQETCLFHDSIANNIAVGKPGASREEIMEAAKKASIHDFVMTLPKGYDTEVGELGDTLSGGERQRIGIARAFLHDAPFLLLDEPTSNLDSLNEGIILKSLQEGAGKQDGAAGIPQKIYHETWRMWYLKWMAEERHSLLFSGITDGYGRLPLILRSPEMILQNPLPILR